VSRIEEAIRSVLLSSDDTASLRFHPETFKSRFVSRGYDPADRSSSFVQRIDIYFFQQVISWRAKVGVGIWPGVVGSGLETGS
jgi:hypothetical protein